VDLVEVELLEREETRKKNYLLLVPMKAVLKLVEVNLLEVNPNLLEVNPNLKKANPNLVEVNPNLKKANLLLKVNLNLVIKNQNLKANLNPQVLLIPLLLNKLNVKKYLF